MDDEAQRQVESTPLPVVRNEGEILRLAMEVAARHGDPDPELIEQTAGTREAATRTTGSWVSSDEPSYLIAMRGGFTAARPTRPRRSHVTLDEGDDFMSFPVQVLVVAIKNGRVTDSGCSFEYPDLASVGPVVTDYRGSVNDRAIAHPGLGCR